MADAAKGKRGLSQTGENDKLGVKDASWRSGAIDALSAAESAEP